MTIGEALTYAVTGVSVVFAVLFLLCIIITLFGKLAGSTISKKKGVAAPAAAPVAEETTEKTTTEGVKLINVADETAAMIMAIVADNTGIAPERLHFEYIKLLEE